MVIGSFQKVLKPSIRYSQGSKNEVPINKESFLINDQDQINPGPFFDPCKENQYSKKCLINLYLQIF